MSEPIKADMKLFPDEMKVSPDEPGLFDGNGPSFIDGKYFSCEGCIFHQSTPKIKNSVAYQIHFCTFEKTFTLRQSARYIGREHFTPEWCPILEITEDE